MTTHEVTRASSSFATVTFHSSVNVGIVKTERQLQKLNQKKKKKKAEKHASHRGQHWKCVEIVSNLTCAVVQLIDSVNDKTWQEYAEVTHSAN